MTGRGDTPRLPPDVIRGAARSAALLVTAVVLGGAAMAAFYGLGQGLLTAGLLFLTGAPVLGLAHVLLRRRARAGSLSRQFAAGIGLVVGATLASVGIAAAIMFVSPHDAFTLGLLLAFAATLAARSAGLLAGGVMDDLQAVRAGLRAVGDGATELNVTTGARDELAELAEATNAMARRLGERGDERDAAEAARRDLMAAVSHDLRTPIASLRVLGEAIAGDVVDDDDRRRYARQLGVHVESLGHLIDDLFELSRLEAGQVEWSMQRVALDELVEETVEAMRPHADARGVRTEVAVPPGLMPAHANPEKVQRVLFNLIQNAIRHTPADGTVTVLAEAASDGVEVEVADTGEGIAPEDRERAFEPFFRGGSEFSRTRSGAGLGLTVCRAIVEAHGGRIWLDESTRGTRVRFSLPGAVQG